MSKIHPSVHKPGFKLVKKLLLQFYIDTDVDQHLAACILLHPCTLGDDQLMATLVDHTGANCRNTFRLLLLLMHERPGNKECLINYIHTPTLTLVSLLSQDTPGNARTREKKTVFFFMAVGLLLKLSAGCYRKYKPNF